VVKRQGIEWPYNDLDFLLVVKRGRPSHKVMDQIKQRYETRLGVEIDFKGPVTPKEISDWPPRLVWCDLLNGHMVLHGPPDILTNLAPESVSGPPPVIEASRLLLDRGAELLRALRVAQGLEKAPYPDFIRRCYYNAVLGMGDALLIAYGAYQTAYTGRDDRFDRLVAEARHLGSLRLNAPYREALAYKFRPDEAPQAVVDQKALKELFPLWGRVFLHVENRRTSYGFLNLDAYVDWNELREPEEHTLEKQAQNLLLNLKLSRGSRIHPREELYRLLPGLLGLTSEPIPDWELTSANFLDLWRRSRRG
jgi:hypothetical protein